MCAPGYGGNAGLLLSARLLVSHILLAFLPLRRGRITVAAYSARFGHGLSRESLIRCSSKDRRWPSLIPHPQHTGTPHREIKSPISWEQETGGKDVWGQMENSDRELR